MTKWQFEFMKVANDKMLLQCFVVLVGQLYVRKEVWESGVKEDTVDGWAVEIPGQNTGI